MGADIEVGKALSDRRGPVLNDFAAPVLGIKNRIEIVDERPHMLQPLAVTGQMILVDGGTVVVLLHQFDLQLAGISDGHTHVDDYGYAPIATGSELNVLHDEKRADAMHGGPPCSAVARQSRTT